MSSFVVCVECGALEREGVVQACTFCGCRRFVQHYVGSVQVKHPTNAEVWRRDVDEFRDGVSILRARWSEPWASLEVYRGRRYPLAVVGNDVAPPPPEPRKKLLAADRSLDLFPEEESKR